MIDLTDKPCDVCGQTRSELLWKTTWPEHRYPGSFSMRRCGECGLLFNSPRLDDTELARLYGTNYYFFRRPAARELARVVSMYQRTVGLVADTIPDKRALDVGCGRGYLPAVLARLGWDAKGIEISTEAADAARTTFGIDVYTGTIEQFSAANPSAQFPLVSAIDVIEHVPSPASFVSALASVVAAGGRLIIDTPNADARNIRTQGLEWPGFNPFHIYLFTVDNLSSLLRRHGLDVVRAFSYNNSPRATSARDVLVRTLRQIRLIGPAARSYFMLKRIAVSNGDPRKSLEDATEAIRGNPSWDDTADRAAPLAHDNAGDNIVVIAARR